MATAAEDLLVYGARAVYVGWYLGKGVPGWTSLVALQILFSGCILVCLGLVGEYVGRVYEQSKGWPTTDHELNVPNCAVQYGVPSLWQKTPALPPE